MKMKIAFHTTLFCFRGTSNAMYEYALYNEIILKNQSIIVYPRHENHFPDMFLKYANRFPMVMYDSEEALKTLLSDHHCDAMYTMKYGSPPSDEDIDIPLLVHCVFAVIPQGHAFAGVSEFLSRKYGVTDYVPHIIRRLSLTEQTLREELGIPEHALVFGRHGGLDTIWNNPILKVMETIVTERDDVFFLFMCPTDVHFPRHPHIITVNVSINADIRQRFINTCDAFLALEAIGHTFGLSCGEFTATEKPVICFDPIHPLANRAHIEIMGTDAIYFRDEETFQKIIYAFVRHKGRHSYGVFSPAVVMDRFKKVFLKNVLKKKDGIDY